MRRVIYFFSGLMVSIFFLVTNQVMAQSNVYPGTDAAYANVINKRSEKIVEKLNIGNSAKAAKVQRIIATQYFDLNQVYILRDKELKDLKENSNLSKDAKTDSLKAIQNRVDVAVNDLHKNYIKTLQANLNNKLVDGVKDGMTYSVLEVTYNAYMQMLPDLTEVQKKQIMDWLIEAREHAMDAGSSEKKHAWFGKYKGRINNYLSKAGINMKQAEDDWKARIVAEKNKKS